jgi:hypothetical protein
MPVRAPRASHAALREAAAASGVTLAEYLARLATPGRLELLAAHPELVGGTFINPRPPDARLVADVAKTFGCRQWEAWLALHTIATMED